MRPPHGATASALALTHAAPWRAARPLATTPCPHFSCTPGRRTPRVRVLLPLLHTLRDTHTLCAYTSNAFGCVLPPPLGRRARASAGGSRHSTPAAAPSCWSAPLQDTSPPPHPQDVGPPLRMPPHLQRALSACTANTKPTAAARSPSAAPAGGSAPSPPSLPPMCPFAPPRFRAAHIHPGRTASPSALPRQAMVALGLPERPARHTPLPFVMPCAKVHGMIPPPPAGTGGTTPSPCWPLPFLDMSCHEACHGARWPAPRAAHR